MHRPGKAASLAPQANVDRFFEARVVSLIFAYWHSRA